MMILQLTLVSDERKLPKKEERKNKFILLFIMCMRRSNVIHLLKLNTKLLTQESLLIRVKGCLREKTNLAQDKREQQSKHHCKEEGRRRGREGGRGGFEMVVDNRAIVRGL